MVRDSGNRVALAVAKPIPYGVVLIPLRSSPPDIAKLVPQLNILALAKAIYLCFVDVLEMVKAPRNKTSAVASPVDHPSIIEYVGFKWNKHKTLDGVPMY